jgi:uncharacterized membrane protein
MLRRVAWMSRRQRVRVRNLAALIIGGTTLAVALVLGAEWPVAVTAAWSLVALLMGLALWPRILRMDPEATKENARDEDFSRVTADLVLLVAAVASLIAIFFLVHEAGSRHGASKAFLVVLAVVAVVLSWHTVQAVYTVRYGDLYYGDPIGGIDFNSDEPPDYHDFLYLGFTIGMTFQVSDTNLQTRAMRRAAIRHALLSFLFVAVLLAVTINVVASLLA